MTFAYALSQVEHDAILNNYINNGQNNRWGFANALTQYARDIDNPDRAYEIEKFGHDLVTLDESDWEEITTADTPDKSEGVDSTFERELIDD